MITGNVKEELSSLVTIFRRAILACDSSSLCTTLQTFPRGACGDASYLLARFLSEQGCGEFEYVLGRNDHYGSHVWLEKSNIIIDITFDQFDENKGSSMVTTDGRFYSQFQIEDRHIADYEIYDHVTILNLTNTYREIIKHI
ncbi:MAG TPA: hypothetical protein PLO63_03275 [Syntrophales bacterium]|nr:hypothetical protein [Syntrophales bacterium]